MSTFETIYAESIYRDLVRLVDAVDQADRDRIIARMVDTVYEATRDHGSSVNMVNTVVLKIDIDQDPDDIVAQVHAMIKPRFFDHVAEVNA
jgi:hypothetical protein